MLNPGTRLHYYFSPPSSFIFHPQPTLSSCTNSSTLTICKSTDARRTYSQLTLMADSHLKKKEVPSYFCLLSIWMIIITSGLTNHRHIIVYYMSLLLDCKNFNLLACYSVAGCKVSLSSSSGKPNCATSTDLKLQ